MSSNRTLYRREFLGSMRLARHYKIRNPEIEKGLRLNALCALDQLRADERGMLLPNHTHNQVLQALNWKTLQHWYGNNPFNVIRTPEWARTRT
jgi:hypothetical protein